MIVQKNVETSSLNFLENFKQQNFKSKNITFQIGNLIA